MADMSERPKSEKGTSWTDAQFGKLRDYLQKRFDESKGEVSQVPTAQKARKKQGPGFWQGEVE